MGLKICQQTNSQFAHLDIALLWLHLYAYMYRLYHRLSGYTGNIPEVVTDKARGRSPRALSVTTEGISQYSQACLWYNLFVAKATGALNRF